MAADPHAALLAQVVDHFVGGGPTTVSLRSLAAGLGTSHRMLIYHFGSYDRLIAQVVDEVEARERAALETLVRRRAGSRGDPDLRAVARAFWRHNSSPDLAGVTRLFFTLYARLLDQGETERAARLVNAWLEPATAALVQGGLARPRAAALARLGLAVTRGLLLDLLATGDRRAVNAAMHAYIDLAFPGSG